MVLGVKLGAYLPIVVASGGVGAAAVGRRVARPVLSVNHFVILKFRRHVFRKVLAVFHQLRFGHDGLFVLFIYV